MAWLHSSHLQRQWIQGKKRVRWWCHHHHRAILSSQVIGSVPNKEPMSKLHLTTSWSELLIPTSTVSYKSSIGFGHNNNEEVTFDGPTRFLNISVLPFTFHSNLFGWTNFSLSHFVDEHSAELTFLILAFTFNNTVNLLFPLLTYSTSPLFSKQVLDMKCVVLIASNWDSFMDQCSSVSI